MALLRPFWLSLIVTLAVGLAAFRVTTTMTSGFLVWSDGLAYFFHARSLVVDGNSDITNEFEEFDRRYPVGQKTSSVMDSIRLNVSRNVRTGHLVSPWPIGMGLLLAPFYAIGLAVESILAPLEGRNPDSYGIIPQYFFGFGSLTFGLLGFWATYLCCREVSDRHRSSIATCGAVLAGPAVFYIFVSPSMAHAVSFGITALLVLLWWRQWAMGTRPRVMLLLGFLLGLLVTIRLQNAIFGVLLAILVVRELRHDGWRKSLTAATAGLVTCAIPMTALALHSLAYGPAQSTFAFQPGGILMLGSYPVNIKSPYFFDVLFSCRHGAFHWAPVFALSTIGLISAVYRDARFFVLFLIFVLQVYLIGGIGIADAHGRPATFDLSNWNEHWKGGASFGMRYLTECTPIFALGLASLLNFFRTSIASMIWAIGLSMLVMWNGLLVLAYGLNTVSRSYCVSYGEMWRGVGQALGKIAGGLN
jgi:hypothetical protein